jgi:hypothetical protein
MASTVASQKTNRVKTCEIEALEYRGMMKSLRIGPKDWLKLPKIPQDYHKATTAQAR